MSTLQKVLAKTLEEHGIYSILDVQPQNNSDFGKNLLIIWLVINIPLLTDSSMLMSWLVAVIFALFVEQVVHLISLVYREKTINFRDTVKNRKIHERINIWSVFVYVFTRMLLQFLHQDGYIANSNDWVRIAYMIDILYVFWITNPTLSIAGFKIPALLETNYLLAKLLWKRILRAIRLALSSNLRFSIPAVVLISIIGVVSSDVWRFFDALTWNQLVWAIAIFLIPLIIASQKRLLSKINQIILAEIDKFDPNSVHTLKKSLKVTAGVEFFSIPDDEYEQYKKDNAWKWQANTLSKAQQSLTHDLKMIAIGVNQATLVSFAFGFFLFILASAIILFSKELLIGFIPTQSQLSILAYSPTVPFGNWLENISNNLTLIPNDILFKYAIITTFFLIGQFIITYPENDDVLREMGINETSVADWISLTYAYQSLKEDGYSYISTPAEFANKYSPYYWLFIYIAPDETPKGVLSKTVTEIVNKTFLQYTDGSNAHLILLKKSALTQTNLYRELNAFYQFRNIPAEIAESADTDTLVYLGKNYGDLGIRHFDNFEEAKTWLEKVVIPLKYQP